MQHSLFEKTKQSEIETKDALMKDMADALIELLIASVALVEIRMKDVRFQYFCEKREKAEDAYTKYIASLTAEKSAVKSKN